MAGSPRRTAPSQATAALDDVRLAGGAAGRAWAGQAIDQQNLAITGGFHQAGGTFTITGSGNIAPVVNAPGGGTGGPTGTIEQHLVGAFAALIAVAVVAALFITAEYRRGLIRTTLAASPRRGQVLAAKALVIGAVSFAAGLAAAVIAVVYGNRLARSEGIYLFHVTWLTELRRGGRHRRAAGRGRACWPWPSAPSCAAARPRSPWSSWPSCCPTSWGSRPCCPRGRPTGCCGSPRPPPSPSSRACRSTRRSRRCTRPASGYFPLSPWAGFAVLCG